MVFTGKKLARICTSSSLWLLQRCVGAWRLASPASSASTSSSTSSRYLFCCCTGIDHSRRFAGTAAAAAAAEKTRPWLGAGGGGTLVAATAGATSSASRRRAVLSMGPIHGSPSVGDKTESIRALLHQHGQPADGLQVGVVSLTQQPWFVCRVVGFALPLVVMPRKHQVRLLYITEYILMLCPYCDKAQYALSSRGKTGSRLMPHVWYLPYQQHRYIHIMYICTYVLYDIYIIGI